VKCGLTVSTVSEDIAEKKVLLEQLNKIIWKGMSGHRYYKQEKIKRCLPGVNLEMRSKEWEGSGMSNLKEQYAIK
jgi:hypothetical protein